MTRTDVANDSRWLEDWKSLCLAHGIRAGHSSPIVEAEALPRGSVFLCFEVPKEPSERDLRLAEMATSVAGVVLRREQAQESLRQSEAEARRLLELNRATTANMGEGMYTVDAQGLVTSVNPEAERLFGWKAEELIGRRIHDVTHYKHPDGSAFPVEQCAGFQVMQLGTVLQDFEDTFVRKDGSFFPVSYSSSPLRDPQGKIVGLVVVFQDITLRKQAEAQLRDRERTQRLLAEIGVLAARTGVGGGMVANHLVESICRRVGEELNVSRCGLARVNLDARQVIVEEVYHNGRAPLTGTFAMDEYSAHFIDDGLAGRTTVMADLAADPRTAERYESRFKPTHVRSHINVPLHREGRWVANFWVSHHEARQWTAGEVESMNSIAERVWLAVEQARTAAALKDSEQRFRQLVERAPFGIYIVDSQFRIAHMNAGSQAGTFKNVRPVIGRDFAEAMHILWPDPVAEQIIAVFRHTLDTGEPYYSKGATRPARPARTPPWSGATSGSPPWPPTWLVSRSSMPRLAGCWTPSTAAPMPTTPSSCCGATTAGTWARNSTGASGPAGSEPRASRW